MSKMGNQISAILAEVLFVQTSKQFQMQCGLKHLFQLQTEAAHLKAVLLFLLLNENKEVCVSLGKRTVQYYFCLFVSFLDSEQKANLTACRCT